MDFDLIKMNVDLISMLVEVLIATILVVTAVIAYLTVRNHRKVEKQKVTIDLMYRINSEKIYDATRLCAPENRPDYEKLKPDQQNLILHRLNLYETIAIGYFNGILDDKMLRDMAGSSIPEAYNSVEYYIKASRKKLESPQRWIKFEKLAKHFAPDKSK